MKFMLLINYKVFYNLLYICHIEKINDVTARIFVIEITKFKF
jgi:hypothetical protein